MAPIQNHILNEIGDKLEKKKDDPQAKLEKLESLSDEELQELGKLVKWIENILKTGEMTQSEMDQLTEDEIFNKYYEHLNSKK